MKIKKSVFFLMIISLIFMIGFVRSDKKSIGKVNFVLGGRGDIKVNHQGQRTWSNARLFSPVYNGDRFRTLSESRCEIRLAKKGTIRIGENADFTFKHDPITGKGNSTLKKGRFWASIKGLFKQNRFQIRTPTAVCSIRGTIYRIDADSSTKVLVYDGAVDVGPAWMGEDDSTKNTRQTPRFQKPVEVQGPTVVPGPFEVTLDQWVRIVAGYQIEVRADGKYNKTKIDKNTDQEDDWVKWNKQRDVIKY
ncbi:hypothetical protein B6I21_04580 [candidate division KSB1 bacterium 4572_119]|nr:MAG: hypothetical protein B6I21_04580 [candidate division KSB1 bacterium 4572_119]